MALLDGFEHAVVTCGGAGGVRIRAAYAGEGPPVLLLHGYPQTHVMWHRVAPALADRFTVVCPDLRGYGDSDKPPGSRDHAAYAKRTMAQDQVAVMRALGFDRFAVTGHDRGARVALRLALDHPAAVTHLAVLDIVPTAVVYGTVDDARARTVWRFFFLTQPAPVPELLIGANPGVLPALDAGRVVRHTGRAGGRRGGGVPAVLRRRRDPRHLRGLPGGRHDRPRPRPGRCRPAAAVPVLAMWSINGLGAQYDVEAIWRRRAPDLRAHPLDCGHLVAEERPDETVEALHAFLT